MGKVNVYEDGKVIARVQYNDNLDYWDGKNWTCGSIGRHLGLTRLRKSGRCSYYLDKFYIRLTSNGDIFDNHKFTCAHKFLPLPCVILVIFNKNNKKYHC